MTAAETLIEGFGLTREGAEPAALAIAKLLNSNATFADQLLDSLTTSGFEPALERREELCAKVAWGVYCQAEQTGGIASLDRGLTEEAFADRLKRDKVAEEVTEHFAWRERTLAKFPDKSTAEILIAAFGLDEPGAERLSHVVAKILLSDEGFASAVFDASRQEKELAVTERQAFLERFASTVYAQRSGKIENVPGNLGPIGFSRLWIRDLVASALEAELQQAVVAPTR